MCDLIVISHVTPICWNRTKSTVLLQNTIDSIYAIGTLGYVMDNALTNQLAENAVQLQEQIKFRTETGSYYQSTPTDWNLH